MLHVKPGHSYAVAASEKLCDCSGPLIGATWAVLYACMGYASYLVWQSSADPGMALSIYALQLALNLAWPFIFFKQKQLRAASIFNLGTLSACV